MRVYHTCGTVLTLVHKISLSLQSNFDIEDGRITITKHRIMDSKNLSPFLSLEKCNIFYCNRCQVDVPYAESRISCDDCGSLYLVTDLKNIGGLVFCRRCLNKNKDFSDFHIFGEKSKTKKQRDKIVDEERGAVERVVRQLGNNLSLPPDVTINNPTEIVNSLWSQRIVENIQVNTTSATPITDAGVTFDWRTLGGETSTFTMPSLQPTRNPVPPRRR